MKLTPALPLVLMLSFSCLKGLWGQDAKTYSIDQGLRVYVAGHSFCVPSADVVNEIAQSAGLKNHTLVGTEFIGGSSVTQHWNLDALHAKAKTALETGKIDVLELSPNQIIPDSAIGSFTDLGLKYNPNLRVTVQESWGPYSTTPAPHGGNPPAPDGESATADSLAMLHAPYYALLRSEVDALNAKLGHPVIVTVPTGQAFFALRDKVRQGLVPGIKTQAELFHDRLGHPTVPALILNAYCHFAVIYQRSPVGLPIPPRLQGTNLPGVDKAALNSLLQELAWAAVLADPFSGVKAPATPVAAASPAPVVPAK